MSRYCLLSFVFLFVILFICLLSTIITALDYSFLSLFNNEWIGDRIVISEDGCVDPENAPIVRINDTVYVLTKNIATTSLQGFVIKRDNIVLDGNGFRIRGLGTEQGIYIKFGLNITIKNLRIENISYSISIYYSRLIRLINNTISYSMTSIYISNSRNISLINNTLINSKYINIGISESSNILVLNNNVLNNQNTGVFLLNTVNAEFINNRIEYAQTYGFKIHGSNIQIINNTVTNSYICISIIGFNNTISNNNLFFSNTGLVIGDTYDTIVLNNKLFNNINCITLTHSSDIVISNNYVLNSSTGIDMRLSYRIGLIDNKLINTKYYGIGIYKCFNNTIANNIFINSGLDIDRSFGNTLFNNTVNNKPLLYLENVFNKSITGNIGQLIVINSSCLNITNLNITNTYIAIKLLNTSRVNLFNNNLLNNSYGLYIYSNLSNITVFNNIIINNDIGIYIRDLSNSLITNNNISCNNIGILFSRTSNITTTVNVFNYNNIGLCLEYTRENIFYNNNFINNTVHVKIKLIITTNYWDNGTIGNYWSDHVCVDRDNNGICDDPYIIEAGNVDHYPLKQQLKITIPIETPDFTKTIRMDKSDLLNIMLIIAMITIVIAVACALYTFRKK